MTHPRHMQSLNSEQTAAVLNETRALCVLAGAGSGKTRVITSRIVDLVQRRNVPPHQIMAVTFTNKAAREMRERVERMLPGAGRGLTVATFHAACARLLREHGAAVGLSPRFAIYDEDESQRLLAQQLEALGSSRQDARAIYRRVEQLRNAGQDERSEISDFDLMGRRAVEILPAYVAALRRADATDFAGLLLETVRLLEADGAESKAIFGRYRHLLVDEYQDSNPIQARLVYAIGRAADSVTVVGDDDQSIYAWRGARAENLLEFLRAFDSAQVVRLERNYRSTQVVLDAANAVIANNPDRLEKKLYTEQGGGALIHHVTCLDERHEARVVVAEIERAQERGLGLDQIAVLYRTNAQSRPLEDELRKRRRPYRVVGGIHFYGRREVKDLLAYLRLAVNPRSDVDLLRVLNVPARGIGDTSRLRIINAAHAHTVPLCDLLGDPAALAAAGLRKPALQRLGAFGALLRDLQEAVQGETADQAVRTVADRSGLLEALEREAAQGEEAADRVQNIGALIAAAREFTVEAGARGQPAELADFLEEAALATDVDTVAGLAEEGAPAVTLMTLHAAKGLEFGAVVICGLEEGLFPQSRDGGLDDPERLAEERRLCYVGITRARQRLTLTHARSRLTFGETRRSRRSRFIDEIPDHLLRRGDSGTARPRPAVRSWQRAGVRAAPHARAGDVGATRLADIDMDFCPDFVDDDPVDSGCHIAVGARVHHATFGAGVVMALEDRGARTQLLIRFPKVGEKRVIARYVSLVDGGGP